MALNTPQHLQNDVSHPVFHHQLAFYLPAPALMSYRPISPPVTPTRTPSPGATDYSFTTIHSSEADGEISPDGPQHITDDFFHQRTFERREAAGFPLAQTTLSPFRWTPLRRTGLTISISHSKPCLADGIGLGRLTAFWSPRIPATGGGDVYSTSIVPPASGKSRSQTYKPRLGSRVFQALSAQFALVPLPLVVRAACHLFQLCTDRNARVSCVISLQDPGNERRVPYWGEIRRSRRRAQRAVPSSGEHLVRDIQLS